MKKILVVMFLLGVLITPLTASAQFGKALTNMKVVGDKTDLTSDFAGSISTVIVGVLSLAGTIFLVLTVYAGILWMTAQGNEDQVTKAKDIVTQAIIGLAITLAAYAITAFVTGKLNPTTSSSVTPPPSAPIAPPVAPPVAPPTAPPAPPLPPKGITTFSECSTATKDTIEGGCLAVCPSSYKEIGKCLDNQGDNLCCGK